ncbi:Hypothetical predicted protein [Octopus vulgaris]|uniref:Uncharacterized protein n=1 Tax=Octopus vulgaris TaxID=6645 RepID=A0AA36B3D9_OCTVU|nr:Hypothetical predicted protein [Octopus vulgaris]
MNTEFWKMRTLQDGGFSFERKTIFTSQVLIKSNTDMVARSESRFLGNTMNRKAKKNAMLKEESKEEEEEVEEEEEEEAEEKEKEKEEQKKKKEEEEDGKKKKKRKKK